MSTSTPTTKRPFPALGEHNYGSWADDMEAYLKTLDLWDITDDPTAAPLPEDATNPTTEERKEVRDWDSRFCNNNRKGQASGQIWLAVEDGQKVHVKEVKSDPAKMWLKLKEVHVQQKPGTRFNAYDALLGLHKLEGESLTSLMARADKAMQDIRALRPRDFTIDSLDNDLASMALIRALPSDYNNFVSSLLLLDSLDLTKLQSAFQNEESQHFARSV
ncbi:hypothetical protein NEOLEDRAFT_1078934, partial [Neolentinus lepideus HHB14362 ss-1]